MRSNKFLVFLAALCLCVTAGTVEAISFISQWSTPPSSSPVGVATDSFGNVYVVDSLSDKVFKYNSNGSTLITQWGSGGTGNGQFRRPFYIAIDSSNFVYVTDVGNNRVQKFDSNGVFITKWGSSGGGNGQFNLPLGIGCDSLGNVYVADEGNKLVQKFDSNGTFITQWTVPNGGFPSQPSGLAVDTVNNIYVSDVNNSIIYKYQPNGTAITNWGPGGSGSFDLSGPEGVACDTNNNVYVCDQGNFRVVVYNSTGTFITEFGSPGTGPGQFSLNEGIAVVGQNTIYVTNDTSGHNVVEIWGISADAARSTLVANPTSVPADGTTTSTITATLNDSTGNPLSGKTVTLAAGGGSSVISAASGPSNSAGQVTFTVKDSTVETVTYTATDQTDGVTITQTAQVSFTSLVPPVPPVPPPPPPAPAPQPPTNVKGILSKSEFATQTDIINTITWSPAPDSFVEGYLVFQGVLQVAEVPAKGPYVVTLHNRKKGPNTYTIVSFNSQGTYSAPVTVTIP